MSITRSVVIDNLVTALKTITTANGYHTEIGNKVYRWRTAAVADNELPCLIVRDTGRDAPNEGTGVVGFHDHTITVQIGLFVDNETSAIQAIQDVLKAVAVDYTLGGVIWDLTDGGDSIYSDQQGQVIFSPTLTLRATYRTTRWQES